MVQIAKYETEEHGIAIYVSDRRYIVIRLTKPMQVMQIPKAAALELAQHIKEAAEMIPDEQDPNDAI